MASSVPPIDEIRQNALALISDKYDVTKVSKDFALLTTNYDRVFFADALLKELNLYPAFVKDDKSDVQAAKAREFGNEMFKKKKLLEAIEFYTKSVALSKRGGETIALAYANRSAVLFEKKMFNECLEDIERAIKNKYPEELMEKLLKRQENAKKHRFSVKWEPYFTELPIIHKGEKSKEFQSATNCVRMRVSRELGRHIVATRDIQAKEVIAIEKSYCSLLTDKKLIHCHECLVLCYNAIGCEHCTQAVYCSVKCRKHAWKMYHRFECPILKMVNLLKLDGKMLALKLALSVRRLYHDIANDALETSAMYRSDRYTEVHNLITNTEKRNPANLFSRAVLSAVLYHLVKNYTDFFVDNSPDAEMVFCELVLRHNQTCAANFHEVTEMAEEGNLNNIYDLSQIGAGVYPFVSLINHSCAPNVVRISHGTTLLLLSMQFIGKGQQLFDNYGYHYAVMERDERQDHLKSQYCFDCICDPCEEDWPLYCNLPHDPKYKQKPITDDEFKRLMEADREIAKKILEGPHVPREKMKWRKPSRERSDIEEIIKQCFAILGNRRATL